MRAHRHLLAILCCICCTGASSCSTLEFTRDTQSSGHFVATGKSITLLSVDFPTGSMIQARENVSDANLPNMKVTSARVVPDFGGFNWVLDILSFRYAKLEGTWGFVEK